MYIIRGTTPSDSGRLLPPPGFQRVGTRPRPPTVRRRVCVGALVVLSSWGRRIAVQTRLIGHSTTLNRIMRSLSACFLLGLLLLLVALLLPGADAYRCLRVCEWCVTYYQVSVRPS